jgi:hypothetical protein
MFSQTRTVLIFHIDYRPQNTKPPSKIDNKKTSDKSTEKELKKAKHAPSLNNTNTSTNKNKRKYAETDSSDGKEKNKRKHAETDADGKGIPPTKPRMFFLLPKKKKAKSKYTQGLWFQIRK